MLPTRLNVVTLVCDDVPARRGFYESLGWSSAVAAGSDFARFELGRAGLSLWARDEAEEEIVKPLRDHGHGFGGFTLAVAVEREELVDQAIAVARSAGARVVSEPVRRPFGGRSGYFADPDGVAWEVVWIPGTTIDGQGRLSWVR